MKLNNKIISFLALTILFVNTTLNAAYDHQNLVKNSYQNLINNQVKIIDYITKYYKDGHGYNNNGFYNMPTKADLIEKYSIDILFNNIDLSQKNSNYQISQFDFFTEESGLSSQFSIIFTGLDMIFTDGKRNYDNGTTYLDYARNLDNYKYTKIFQNIKDYTVLDEDDNEVIVEGMSYLLDSDIRNIIDYTALNYSKYGNDLKVSLLSAETDKLLINYHETLKSPSLKMFIKNKTTKANDLGNYQLVDIDYYKINEQMVYSVDDIKNIPKINGLRIKIVDEVNNTGMVLEYSEYDSVACTDEENKASSKLLFDKTCGWIPEVSTFKSN